MYKAILSWEARVIIYLRFEQNSHVLFGFVTAANWTSRVYNTHGQDADNTGGEWERQMFVYPRATNMNGSLASLSAD